LRPKRRSEGPSSERSSLALTRRVDSPLPPSARTLSPFAALAAIRSDALAVRCPCRHPLERSRRSLPLPPSARTLSPFAALAAIRSNALAARCPRPSLPRRSAFTCDRSVPSERLFSLCCFWPRPITSASAQPSLRLAAPSPLPSNARCARQLASIRAPSTRLSVNPGRAQPNWSSPRTTENDAAAHFFGNGSRAGPTHPPARELLRPDPEDRGPAPEHSHHIKLDAHSARP